MTIKLEHKIALQSGAAFLELDVFTPCEDIVGFLEDIKQGKESFESSLQEAAIREMRRLGFLDSSNSLTQKGEEVIESKGRYIRECGKYQIDFTENDVIFGGRIFRARRAKADESEPQLKEVEFYKSPYYILNEKNEAVDKIKLQKAHIEHSTQKTKALQYKRIYELNSNGEVRQDREYLGDKEHKGQREFLDKGYFERQYQEALDNNWDKKHYRLDSEKINEFIEKRHIKDIRTLRVQKLQNGSFLFENIPIAPKEEQDAHHLLELCLMKDLDEEYHTSSELKLKQKGYRDRIEFLNDDRDCFVNLEDKFQQNKQSFWHYYATNDLAPQQSFKPFIKDKIVLQHNENISYQEVVEKITQGRRIEAFIYIDSYFTKEYQIKRAEIITQCFQAQKSLIITDSRNVEALQKSGLNAENAGDSKPHDRYFILAFDDEYEFWSITQSDFLRFDESVDSLSSQTKGMAEGATFSKVSNGLLMFSDELQARIKAFLEA